MHLNPEEWSFGFDNAKKRAGQCNWSTKRITVSRYLAATAEDDDIHQVLLHEVAHAMAGNAAGHGPRWKETAASIGYVGTRLYPGAIANELAPWVGTCPAGHVHYRHRRPAQIMACGKCSRRFDPAHVLVWENRVIPPAVRRSARSARAS
ncbi:SprT-like family protein [Glaciihabitans tibetensis]|uniref:SprT-like family protein n=2 Tax=Glaciihabitans tibetensis TaxID=1266600 RepID=A0A2T0VBF2_9MICO|nr:SprT-like family protein [Glaciihabitans tibetensis]